MESWEVQASGFSNKGMGLWKEEKKELEIGQPCCLSAFCLINKYLR